MPSHAPLSSKVSAYRHGRLRHSRGRAGALHRETAHASDACYGIALGGEDEPPDEQGDEHEDEQHRNHDDCDHEDPRAPAAGEDRAAALGDGEVLRVALVGLARLLEVGLGGRWDATTATHPRVTCVTGIGLDHTRILGNTLEAIAAEKGGVIKPGQACVLGVGTATPDTMEDVLLDRCREQGVVPTLLRPLDAADAPGEMHPGTPRVHDDLPRASYRITHRPSRVGDTLIMDVTTRRATYDGVGALKPAYQAANIACAICVAEAYLDRALDPQRLMDSLVVCPTPGRFDVLSGDPLVLVDACHNPQSVDAFLSAVRAAEPDIMARPQLLCAVLADKDVEGIVESLAQCFPSVSVTQTSSPRAISAEELGRMFAACDRPPHHVFPSVADAVSGLAGESFVACGSITLAGEVCGIMRGPSR